MQHLHWAELTCSLYTPTMQNSHHAKLSRHHLHHAPFTRSTDAMRRPDHEAFHPCGTYTMHNVHAAFTACSSHTTQRLCLAIFIPCSIQTMQRLYAGFIPHSTYTMQYLRHAAFTRHLAMQQSHHAAIALGISTQHWCRGVGRGAEGTHPSWPWAGSTGDGCPRSLCCQQPSAPRPQGTEGSP